MLGRNEIQQRNYIDVSTNPKKNQSLTTGQVLILYEFFEDGTYLMNYFSFEGYDSLAGAIKKNNMDKLLCDSDDLPLLCTMGTFLDISVLSGDVVDKLVAEMS